MECGWSKLLLGYYKLHYQVLHNISDSLIAVVVKGGAHHFDLR